MKVKVRRLSALAAAVGLLGSSLSGNQPQTPAASVPLVPVAASTLVMHPDIYAGTRVTVTAAVDRRLGATAFTIAQNRAKGAGQDVLVLVPLLTAPVAPDAYVTVIGEAVRFDPVETAAKMKDAMPSLSAEVAAGFRGRAAIIATSVINGAMNDLAKRPPPPMSPEEESLSKLMKQIGPAFNALRQAATASNAADAAQQAGLLKTAFTDTAPFWKTRTLEDAIKWSGDARRESEAIETAAGKAEWNAVNAGVPRLQQICASCHGAHRDRLDDGSYRFKKGH
jgi:hypothetical protein